MSILEPDATARPRARGAAPDPAASAARGDRQLGSAPLAGLTLGRTVLDRAGHLRADPDLLPRLLADPATRVIALTGDRMPVHAAAADPASDARTDMATERTDGLALAYRSPQPEDAEALSFFLGLDDSGTAYLGMVAAPGRRDPGDPADRTDLSDRGAPFEEEPSGPSTTLREGGLRLSPLDADVFGTTQALAAWHRGHPHCPRCGAPTSPVLAGWVRRCEADGSEHYPRTDPAVIMAVIDEAGQGQDRLLLGRNAGWPEGRFSVLAGFVEPGESFESAVAREVAEEVGIEVTDVRYLGSQPWPFPASMMVGCAARAVTTELVLDPTEIAEALWVTREQYLDALRRNEIRTPVGISIAKRLIERWLGSSVEEALGQDPPSW